jgi:hypothetical protein
MKQERCSAAAGAQAAAEACLLGCAYTALRYIGPHQPKASNKPHELMKSAILFSVWQP